MKGTKRGTQGKVRTATSLLTLGMSVAPSKVSEGTQLAGGRVYKGDTGAQMHEIMESLECQPGQGI